MTLSPVGATASRFPANRHEVRTRWVDQIRVIVRAKASEADRRQTHTLQRIHAEEQWDAAKREMRQVFVDAQTHQRARVRLIVPAPNDAEAAFEPSCGCADFSDRGYCRHVHATLYWLEMALTFPFSRDYYLDMLLERPPRPDWETTLDILDQALVVEESKQAAAPESRLSWRIEVSGQRGKQRIALHAYEQKVSKSTGRWTKGRKLPWERVFSRPELVTLEADRKIVAAARGTQRNNTYYYASPYAWNLVDVFPALMALIGHPFVSWLDDPDRAIRVVSGELGLAVVQDGRSLQLLPQVGDERLSDECDLFLFENQGAAALNYTHSRLTVAPGANKRLMSLVQHVSETQPKFPKKAEQALIERLPALAARAPVSLPAELKGEAVEADARLILRLVPGQAAGLSAALRLRPAPGGVDYAPGKGPSEILGLRDGKRVVYTRKLEDEELRAAQIAGELRLDTHATVDSWEWRIDQDEDALDLLAMLEERGGDDLIVEWPQGQRLALSGEIAPSSLRVQIDDRHDWFGLSGSVEVNGEQIPLDQLLASLRAGRRFVEISAGRYARIAKVFRDRLTSLADAVHPTRHGLEIGATAAPVLEDLVDTPAALKACAGWQSLTQRLESARALNPEPPRTLAAELRDYQVEGYRWMRRLAEWGVGACLADDMGLGKTVQALAVLIDLADSGPALIVAPTSVGFNWVRECQRFAPTLRPIQYREAESRTDAIAEAGPGDLVIVSYGLLQRDAKKFASRKWGVVVLDEAQFIKNARTKTAQAARSLDADWRVALTGTPLENHLGELWSLFRVISPGLFGSWDRFRERFAGPIERHHDIERRHALSRMARPFILRRTKAEVLDELPERTEILRHAELSATERKRYEDARLAAVARLAGVANEEKDRRFEVLAALTRLRQLACHVSLVDPEWTKSSAKLDLLMEIVDELRQGAHRALVFSQFTSHLDLIRHRLDAAGIKYQYLDGQTPAKQRTERIDAFQHGEGDLFLISLKAGGTGLNLTAADYVIHMDPWWNPAVEDQATDRAHRIGQTRPVTVYRLVAKDTIEEKILALHADKRDLVAGVLDGADQAGKLSTEQLVDLIRDGGQN